MLFSGLVQDTRFAFRSLRRTPGFTAVIVITLALAIGGTTALFSVADAALFRPLPFRDPERLVMIDNNFRVPIEGQRLHAGSLDIATLRALPDAFEEVGAFAVGGLNLTGGAEPVRARVAEVTPNVFGILGVRPEMGRPFVPDDERPSGADVVMLSHGIWQRQFGSDPGIVGKRIELNGHRFEVIGVMPARVTFPSASELWITMPVPLTFAQLEIFPMLVQTLGIARLKPGITSRQADAHIAVAVARLGARPHLTTPIPEVAVSIRPYFSGDTAPRIRIVAGLIALVLLAACANVSGLLVARSNVRRREMAIRKAIGASRARLIRQLLTESLVLSIAGCVTGIVVAALAMRLFETLVPPDLAALTPPRLDLRVLGSALALAFVTAIGFGVLPALAGTRHPAGEALKAAGLSGGARRGANRLSSTLVVIEVAVAVVLLVGSGLMLHSLARLFAVETGIRPDQVVTARVALARARYPTVDSRRQFYEQVTTELSRLPGVQASAVVNMLPLRGELVPVLMFHIVGGDSASLAPAEHIWASADYFEAMGIRIVAGRSFIHGDPDQHVAVISQSLAKKWPGGAAISSRVRVGTDSVPRVIVGVVNDVMSTTLDGKRENQIYMPLEEGPYPQATIVVRGALPPAALMTQIRTTVRDVDPKQVAYEFQTMKAVESGSVAARRASGELAVAFGVLALILAGVGVYGLLAFTVSRRLPELGIRLALGAQPGDVVRLVVRDGLTVTIVGAAVGTVAAYASARVLRSMLFEVSPTDPVVFVLVPPILIVVALVAAFQPARRAAGIDPLVTIRAD